MMDILAFPLLVPLLPPETKQNKTKQLILLLFPPGFLLQWKVLPFLNPSLFYVNEHVF